MSEKNLEMKQRFLELGWDQIPRFVMRMTEIGPADKLVFSFILNRIRDFGGGRAFPSIESIGKNTGLPDRTVKRSTAALVNVGLLERKKRGMGKTNEYGLPGEIPIWILDKYGKDWVPDRKRGQIDPSEGPNRPVTEAKSARIKRVTEREQLKETPSGALSPSAPKQSGLPPASGEGPVGGEGRTADCEDPALEASQNDFMPQEPLKGANPPPAMNQTGRIRSSEGDQTVREGKSPQTVCEKPFTSSRSGSGITIPGEDEEPKRKRKPKGQYDPSIPPDQWDSTVAAGYFRQKFKSAWPGEGAPQASIAALSAIKGRINWLKAEGIGVGAMKQAIDHLFEGWSNGLPSRLKWQGSRPTLALIENIRLFERLVREVQSGTGAHGLVDEYKDSTPEDRAMIEKYAEKDRICVALMDEGMGQWEAEKEAKRRVGL